MSEGRMTAEQTPDIEAVLAEHQGWASERYDDRGTYYVMCCDCGWEEPKRDDAYEGSDGENHRAHVADRLAAAVREARAAELREAAGWLPSATEGTDRAGTETWRPHDRDVYSLAIEEAQVALRGRADRIAVDAPEGGA